MYANIKTLLLKSCTTPDQNFNRSNVINLIVYTTFDSLDWVHVLTKLRHLTIDDCAILTMDNSNILLDNTTYLCSLTIIRWICVYIQQYHSPSPPTIEWLEQQYTRLCHSNCIIVNGRRDYSFWLG
ncbi:hypothetical protein I4U23_021996 [Adineta vaga]|nr:hypothetical protein I4U23_021996 [Adineta vaga]